MNRIFCGLSFLSTRRGLAVLAVAGLLVSFFPARPVSGGETVDAAPSEEEEVRLTLEECLRLALEKNLSLSAEALNIGIAEQGVVSARAAFDPQLGLDLLYEGARSEESDRSERGRADLSWSKRMRTGQVFRMTHSESRFDRGADVAMSPFYDLEWAVSVTQPLARGAGRTANMAPVWIAENDRKGAVFLTEESVMDLIRVVERAYLDLIYASRYLDVQRSALKLAQELLARNQELVLAEKLPGRSIEVLEAKASVAAREEGIIIALNGIAKGEDAIRRLLNLPVPFGTGRRPLVPVDEPMVDLTVPQIEESLSFALAHRPGVQALKFDLDSARLELAAARNNRLPEVDLRADLGLTGSDARYGSSFDELAEGRDYMWQVGVSVSIPWGNRAARSLYARAKLNYQKASILYNDFLEELKLQVINAHRDIDRDLKRMAATKAAVEQSELQLQVENERLEQDMSNSFRILEFQDDLIAAKIRRIAATVDFNQSYFNLLRVEGRAIRNEKFDLTDIVEKILYQVHSPRRRSPPSDSPG